MNDEIERLDLGSEDLVGGRVEELLRLFPEAATEGTGRIDFERLRLALGDEVAEGDERYAFTWPGKRAAIAQAQTPSYATLRPAPEESVDWDTTQNLYIEGDNLEVLKLLQRSYHGRVKLIYIDPPYNTGHDFVYEDSFGDPIATYKEQAGLAGQANPDTSGRYHSRWCSMMYPRLKLARELLADDGVIFISIDDNESKNLRALCDEVFGEANFVGDIAWQRNYSTRNDSKGIPAETEHLFCYSRQQGWQPNRLPRTEQMDSKYGNPDGDVGPWRTDNAYAPGAATHQGMVYAIQHPFTGELLYPSNGRAWTFDQATMLNCMQGWCDYELREIDDADRRAEVCGIQASDVRKGVKAIMLSRSLEESSNKAREIYERGPWPRFFFTRGGRGGIARKTYLDKVGGRLVSNFWPYSECGQNDEAKKELQSLFDGTAPFDTPKPTRLMKRILDIATDDGSLVLDFFSGSAAMAHAVMAKNAEDGGRRTYVMVQLPEAASGAYATIAEIGKERIRRAGKKIASEVDEANRQLALGEEPRRVPDVGFRVFKLDESGIARPQGVLQESIVGADRSQLDIVFELMLKWGLDLTYPVERVECAGYPCWSVAAGELVCCLEQGLSMEALHAVAALGPRRVLLLDSILTDTLKLNAQQIFSHAAERLGHPVDLRTV